MAAPVITTIGTVVCTSAMMWLTVAGVRAVATEMSAPRRLSAVRVRAVNSLTWALSCSRVPSKSVIYRVFMRRSLR